MRLLQGIAELVAPTRCVGCEAPGALLCATCDAGLPLVDGRRSCHACGAPYGALVCTECWDTQFAFSGAVALGELDGPLARAVVLHKDAGERRLGALLGVRLSASVMHRWDEAPEVVTWIPPTAGALARRGFDHGRSLATPVAAALGVPALRMLERSRALDQRALGRRARAVNAEGTFCAIGEMHHRVLLVDDVLTTGATLDAAASALLAAGVGEVRVAVVARAW